MHASDLKSRGIALLNTDGATPSSDELELWDNWSAVTPVAEAGFSGVPNDATVNAAIGPQLRARLVQRLEIQPSGISINEPEESAGGIIGDEVD
jgi:hypothetical protein